MKVLRQLILISGILILVGASFADSFQGQEALAGLFAQGNSEYQKGNYPAAEQCYRQILDSGIESGPLYYNLGNTCFKQKRMGEAIYFWEKAQLKLPADREIRENLELANMLIVDRIEIPPDPFPIRIITVMQNLLTTAQEAWLVVILFIASNALFAFYLLGKNLRHSFRAFIGSLVIGLLFVLFACSLTWKIYDGDFRKKGIAVEQKVDVRSAPGNESIIVFTIHEGIKVRVHEYSNGWYQISLPNGWSGWLRQNSIRVL
jgi:tetratricopeptide (TPR) repeat protein